MILVSLSCCCYIFDIILISLTCSLKCLTCLLKCNWFNRQALSNTVMVRSDWNVRLTCVVIGDFIAHWPFEKKNHTNSSLLKLLQTIYIVPNIIKYIPQIYSNSLMKMLKSNILKLWYAAKQTIYWNTHPRPSRGLVLNIIMYFLVFIQCLLKSDLVYFSISTVSQQRTYFAHELANWLLNKVAGITWLSYHETNINLFTPNNFRHNIVY